jgi:hypothetical protein
MSFCGTPRLEKRWKMRGFASTCHGFVSQLMHMKYKQAYDTTAAGDQYRLFHFSNEERDGLKKFAKNLLHFQKDVKREHDGAYWVEFRELEFHNYDFYVLFERVDDDELRTVAAIIDRAADEYVPTDEEYKTVKEFLNRLAHRADSRAEDYDDGCF